MHDTSSKPSEEKLARRRKGAPVSDAPSGSREETSEHCLLNFAM